MSKLKQCIFGLSFLLIMFSGMVFSPIQPALAETTDWNNEDMVALLPTSGITVDFPTMCNIFMGEPDAIVGYQPVKFVETDTSNETYQEILQVVNSVTSDCSTDYEKAKAIQQWVSSNIKYGGSMAIGDTVHQIYSVYTVRECHCMGFAKLTGFMLYLAGIPNATVASSASAHMWNMALTEGKWVMVDSTHNRFDFDVNDESHNKIDIITFGEGNMVFAIDDTSGVKLVGVGARAAIR
ncbi:MAG: transglutaminase-like domain-containing protein, partial [Oscillospiraceae bacterium]|nr:transglutaminase-like domain-containing protein [Oscillospiraceae bacterium]